MLANASPYGRGRNLDAWTQRKFAQEARAGEAPIKEANKLIIGKLARAFDLKIGGKLECYALRLLGQKA